VGVKDMAIEAWLKANQGTESVQLEGLKTNLKCGTECGSCVPQLKRMISLKASLAEKSANPSLTI
jgi:assimilatory nitrate reductase catalytic subunit